MRKGFAERAAGYRAAYGTLPVSVFHALNVRHSSNVWLVWGADEVHAEITSATHDLSDTLALSSVTDPFEISSTILNGLPVFTNGLDDPHYWDLNTANDFAPLTNWPTNYLCKSIFANKFHLVALDIYDGSNQIEEMVMWSDAAAAGAIPGAWTAAAGNQAGSALLADTPGPCMMGLPLRGQAIIYKRSSMYAMEYVGGNNIYEFSSPLFADTGVLTRHGACVWRDQHLVVTGGDVILTDGVQRRSIARGRVRDALFRNLNTDEYQNLFVVPHREKNEVWICFPETGESNCTRALIWDATHDSYGERDLPDVTCGAVGLVNDTSPSNLWTDQSYTWAASTRKWGDTNFSEANEDLVLGYGTTLEQQDTTDAVSIDASIGKYDMDFGSPERVKMVQRVNLHLDAGYGTLYVRVGGRMMVQDPINWQNEYTVTEPDDSVPCMVVGKFISVEVRSDEDDTWQLTGFDVEYNERGYF